MEPQRKHFAAGYWPMALRGRRASVHRRLIGFRVSWAKILIYRHPADWRASALVVCLTRGAGPDHKYVSEMSWARTGSDFNDLHWEVQLPQLFWTSALECWCSCLGRLVRFSCRRGLTLAASTRGCGWEVNPQNDQMKYLMSLQEELDGERTHLQITLHTATKQTPAHQN